MVSLWRMENTSEIGKNWIGIVGENNDSKDYRT